MKRRAVSIIIAVLVLCCGCGKENKTPTVVENYTNTKTEFTNTALNVEVTDSNNTIFSAEDTLPVIVNGELIAFAKINQLEKEKIVDWSNKKAVENLVDHSYSINLDVDYLQDSQLTFKCIPTMINKKGEKVSSVCNVGWTGFKNELNFYSKGKDVVEVGFQPEVSNEKGTSLHLIFETSKGTSEEIILDKSFLKSAKKGAKIRKSGTLKVKSTTGGKYTIKIYDVEREPAFNSNTESKEFLRFKYKITYDKKPSKGRTNIRFDQKRELKLLTKMQIGVKGASGGEVLYASDYGAWSYLDDESMAKDGKELLSLGKSTVYECNRELGAECSNDSIFMFTIEFPEELDGATTQEILNFDGRFCTMQLQVERVKK